MYVRRGAVGGRALVVSELTILDAGYRERGNGLWRMISGAITRIDDGTRRQGSNIVGWMIISKRDIPEESHTERRRFPNPQRLDLIPSTSYGRVGVRIGGFTNSRHRRRTAISIFTKSLAS